VREHDVAPADVTAVEVTVSPYVHRLVGAPFEPGADPQVTAQFSVQYSVACAILHRRLTVADIQNAAVMEPAVGKLARSVKVTVDEKRGNSRGATVRITTRRHGLLEQHREHIPGSPEAPLTAADLQNKLRECSTEGVAPLGKEGGDLLSARIDRVEEAADMADFFTGIAD
jgi:2-methylcitrate dehydratase PrpD